MQKAVIYARYSSNAQRDVSIDQQISACRKYAESLGIEIVKIYEDRAFTGTSDKRPGFQRMIQDAPKAKWEYVIVYALDRFTRDRYDSVVYKRKLKEAGVRVLSAMEHISDDPTGVLMESILEGFAEYYSKELAQKIQRGMRDNACKCMVNGILPVGYDKGPDGKYAVNEAEAAVVREVFARISKGETVAAIQKDLEQRNIRTKRGGFWTRNILYKALANERYTGVYIYGDIRIEGGVPEIVPKDLFNAVQLCMGAKKEPRKIDGVPQRRRQENGLYLLTGKLFCGDCKSAMVGVSGRSKTKNPYFYYACQKRRSDHSCSRTPIRREQLEHAVAAALQKHVLNDETILALADAVVAYQEESSVSLELKNLRANLKDVQRSMKNILQAIENGVYTPTVQKRLMDLESEQAQLQARINQLEPRAQSQLARRDIILMLHACREGDLNDPLYRQMLLDSFLIKAYVYDDKLQLIFTISDGRAADVDIPLSFDGSESLSFVPEGSYNAISGSPTKRDSLWAVSFCWYDDLPRRFERKMHQGVFCKGLFTPKRAHLLTTEKPVVLCVLCS